MTQLIKKLCLTPAPSGREAALADKIAARYTGRAVSICKDPLGSLIIRRAAKEAPGRRLVVLSAHLDSIFLMVTGHYEGGFLSFSQHGTDGRILPGQSVCILASPPIAGVISSVPPHLSSDTAAAFDSASLYIDTGLDKNTLEKAAPIGTQGIFTPDFTVLNKTFYCGTSLDDRAGCAAIMTVFDKLEKTDLPFDLALCFSSQEELRRKGAAALSFSLAPDLAIVVDVTHGTTYDNAKNAFPLGSGVSIGVGPTLHRGYTRELLACAEAGKIPYTTEVLTGDSGTDAFVMETAGLGVPCVLASIPLRYMHTPVEMLAKKDVDALVKLLCRFVKEVSLG